MVFVLMTRKQTMGCVGWNAENGQQSIYQSTHFFFHDCALGRKYAILSAFAQHVYIQLIAFFVQLSAPVVLCDPLRKMAFRNAIHA